MARGTKTWLLGVPLDICEMLLRTSPLGRLGVVVDGRPVVFPVCGVYVGGTVAFPTRPGTKLHAALTWPWVCYEVDGVSRDGQGGWSVLVQGRAEIVTDPREIELAASLRAAPWHTGDDVIWVRIVPDEISGRRIEAEGPLTR